MWATAPSLKRPSNTKFNACGSTYYLIWPLICFYNLHFHYRPFVFLISSQNGLFFSFPIHALISLFRLFVSQIHSFYQLLLSTYYVSVIVARILMIPRWIKHDPSLQGTHISVWENHVSKFFSPSIIEAIRRLWKVHCGPKGGWNPLFQFLPHFFIMLSI